MGSMKMMKLAPILALGILAVPVLSPAQVAKQGNGYLFRMKFVKGQKQNFKMASTTSGFGDQAMKMGMNFSMTVKSVKKDQATVVVSNSNMTMNGQPTNMGGSNNTAEITMDSTGKQVGGAAGAGGFSGNFPVKPLPIGGKWTSDLPVPGGGAMPGGKITATYTFTGFTSVKGKNAAKVAIKIGGGATGSGTMLINAADGSLLSSTMAMTITMPNPQTNKPINLKSNVNITRV